jgi:hypothetical protein
MGGIGNEDAGPLNVAALAMVGPHHKQTGEFAMRAGGRLQRHRGKAADLGEPLLQFEHQREIALHGVHFLQRVRVGKSRKPRDLLVDLGIEFHGAGAERVEAGIDAEVTLRQRKMVPHHVELRQFGQAEIGVQRVRRQCCLGHVARRQIDAMPARHAQLVDGGNGLAAHGWRPIM